MVQLRTTAMFGGTTPKHSGKGPKCDFLDPNTSHCALTWIFTSTSQTPMSSFTASSEASGAHH